MPKDKDIKKTLVIGSGPIVIGQAAEFDYAGTQACRALKEDGIEIVLVNSNPATIMTDVAMADSIYVEPLTAATLKRIIEHEHPDSVLPTLGGQTGLNLAMKLANEGFLSERGIRLLGAKPETIGRAEDRKLFKQTMEKIGQPVIPSEVVTNVEDAIRFARSIGYPLIVRPGFTLGGAGGGIANDEEELGRIARDGLRLSPIGQILVEKSVAGWKEIEFEVMRDKCDNCITVCSMENFDPVGIHTGDSIVIAPAVTLSDKEYQMLRTAALSIISELEIEGGCNCQFALATDSFEYAVIEVNPRVSRSSALASKATGYPIAKVAAKIAIGYRLDEITNAVTGKTCACFEPALDYVAVKFPKWPFDKFASAPRTLGTQMKATGEVMALADNFEAALMKAVRGAEIHQQTLYLSKLENLRDEELRNAIKTPTDERIFQVFEALRRGVSCDAIYDDTRIDRWFLCKLQNLVDFETRLRADGLSDALYREGKRLGYPDAVLEKISEGKVKDRIRASYKMVDTCAGEFSASTPYFYASMSDENEALEFIESERESRRGKKGTIVVLGSGPIRIGQGIEFDYSSVHCVWALKKQGYEVAIINNNPETVSTDFDTADRLYFEPLTPEDVRDILEMENPIGVVAAYGGQTAIKLTRYIHENGYRILGTSFDSIDLAEDRERFDSLLGRLGILRPEGGTALNMDEALDIANRLGYPVLVRPSYVLGGQNMSIAFSDNDLREFMEIILGGDVYGPVLIDKYLRGIEIEVDAICDGSDILIPGIMEHVERTGIHSGDSIAVYPSINVTDRLIEKIVEHTRSIALAMKTLGLVNVQYIIHGYELYVIEVNPRASRTVPYISKVTGIPMVDLATRAMLGERLADMGYGTGLYPPTPYTAVKVPVFSFEKLHGVDTHLGPEMKSTGEVLGIGKTLEEAMYKGLLAAGYNMERRGGVLFTVLDSDKSEIVDVAKKYSQLGLNLYATKGTARVLSRTGLSAITIHKISESSDNVATLIESGKVQYIVSTSTQGRDSALESVQMRSLAVRLGIPCLTSIDTATAVADSLRSKYSEENTELVDIADMRRSKNTLRFSKLHSCGKDDLYFDCFDQDIVSPESLSIMLGDRHFGVGGYGVVMIYKSDDADAYMRLFNTDGSEGLMSASAVACTGKLLFESGRTCGRKTMTIGTQSGTRRLDVFTRYGKVVSGEVNLGVPMFAPPSIPVKLPGDRVMGRVVEIGNKMFCITCVSMGSPHCVIFCDDVEHFDVETIGPMVERAEIFPKRANVEFVKVIDETTLRMRIWERGDGETMASGSGACAAVAAAVENGFCSRGNRIRVIQNGGDMTVDYSGNEVILHCRAHKVFDGSVEI
ncbi:MAG: carbamoyl-phosphate synthase large subunit [Synergistaceae bacterium]|jgi:carbamoyl-phosphate synthase large subunit|nr:carbamoyl-phosphate synthase large subunit [Synergistaceae bacterium]